MQTVEVVDGDTWDSIATANGVTLASLLSANGIDPDSSPDAPEVGALVPLPDDPPEHCVAPGHDQSLEVQGGSVAWIRLALMASDARREDGSLRLYAEDGSHDVTLAIAENFIQNPNGTTVDIRFDSLDPSGSYCLDYVASDGTASSIVASTPFSQLQVDDDAKDDD